MTKPFSMSYVLTETLKHIERSIDISIRKTISRMPDFEGNQEKIKELLSTLTNLNRISSVITEIKENNKQIFGEQTK